MAGIFYEIFALLFGNLQITLLFGVVFLLTLWYIRWPKNLPPGPTPLPIVGNTFLISNSKKQQYEVYQDLWKEYGGIVTFYLGTNRAIIVNDFSILKEATIKKADYFSHRFTPPILKWTVGNKGSVFFGDGQEWKERRRFVLVALKNFGVGKKSLEYKINEEARYVMEKFDSLKGEPFDPRDILVNIIANVVCSITFGKRFDYDDEKFHHIVGMFGEVFSSLSLGGLMQALPFLVYTPIYGFIKDNFNALRSFISGILKEHQDTLDGEDVRDIIDMYLLEIQRQVDSSEEVVFKPQDAWRLILEIFGGGTDTTTSSMLFGFLFMTQFPDIQKKIQAEIDEVIGSDRQPSLDDKPNMPFTEATLLELLRFRPIAAQVPPRQVHADVELAGYNIPKGTVMLVNIYGILHDPKLWDKPEEFNPSRFLSEDGKTVVKPEYFIPFGIGKRICIGEHLARMEQFLFFTNFLQRFNIRIPEGDAKPSLELKQGITSRPVVYRVCLTPRD